MTKAQEQFLLKCDFARAILREIWTKGILTDEKFELAYRIIIKKLKEKEDAKSDEK